MIYAHCPSCHLIVDRSKRRTQRYKLVRCVFPHHGHHGPADGSTVFSYHLGPPEKRANGGQRLRRVWTDGEEHPLPHLAYKYLEVKSHDRGFDRAFRVVSRGFYRGYHEYHFCYVCRRRPGEWYAVHDFHGGGKGIPAGGVGTRAKAAMFGLVEHRVAELFHTLTGKYTCGRP
jgi:hypothetical protein